jgi:nicotinamidase-related amidase
MLRVRRTLSLGLFALTLVSAGSQTPVLAQVPTMVDVGVPDPAAVSLDASTTAFLAIDILQTTCGSNPLCVATVPNVGAGLSAARAASAHVVYSVHLAPDNNIIADIAPMPTDQVFVAIPGDKFFDSNLDYLLRQAGTTTLIITGVSSNSGVVYTAGAATQRGYTVVVAEDGISAANDLSTTVALWQLLHGPGANPQNVPLQAKAVTLSRTDLITYK